MALDELCKLVEDLRRRSQDFESQLRQSEALTRYVLVDPILRSLGWDTENPDLVRPEYSPGMGAADCALLQLGHPLAFIEAKPLGQSLQQGILQSINYCLQSGTQYFTVTDGLRWEIYQTHAPVPMQQKRIAAFDLSTGDIKASVLNLLSLLKPASAKPSVLVGQSTESAMPVTLSPGFGTEAPSVSRLDGVALTAGGQTRNAGLFSSFSMKSGDRPPRALLDPDGASLLVRSWKDVVVSVAERLVKRKLLTVADCPVSLPAGSRHLVGTAPKRPSGHDSFAPVYIETLRLETHASSTQLVRQARYLIERFGRRADFEMVG